MPPHRGSQSRVQGALGDHQLADGPRRQPNTTERRPTVERSTGPPARGESDAASLVVQGKVERIGFGLLIGLGALGAGCGDRIEGGPGDAPVPAISVETVSVSGRITFDYVPVVSDEGVGLDYNATEARPARGVSVHLLTGDRTEETAITDKDGRYRIDAPRETEVSLSVRAELGTGDSSPLARVLDNTREDSLYTMDGMPFSTGDTDLVRDLHAASGWTGTGYGETRAAAAFAILDVVYEAMQWVRSVDPDVEFVPLEGFWSPDNVGIPGLDGEPDYGSGRIGATHYRREVSEQNHPPAIYLVGSEDEDTDEYDRSIIAHEWMHYFLDTLSRDDSIGGRHALGEQLDMRLAYSEGVATALAATMLGETDLKYTLGPQQAHGGRFSVEHVVPRHPGWFSEDSIMAIVFDLLDPVNDDGLELGFGHVYEVLVNDVRETPALTSLFPFIHALKTHRPAHAAAIDTLFVAHRIEPIVDAYGSTETNSGYPPSGDTLPVYSSVTLSGPPAKVCSTAQFASMEARGNGLGAWRFVRFTAEHEDSQTVSVTPTNVPPGARAEPVLELFRAGLVGRAERGAEAACTPDTPARCIERLSVSLPEEPGEYVFAVAEATHTARPKNVTPIGRTCFDVEVSRP